MEGYVDIFSYSSNRPGSCSLKTYNQFKGLLDRIESIKRVAESFPDSYLQKI